MSGMDREELINKLAASMGAGNFAKTKFEQARFDPDTGTLFCNGIVITAGVAEQAIRHFTTLEQKCDKSDPASKQMAMIYMCAIESIKMLRNPKMKRIIKRELELDKDLFKED